MMFDFRYNPGRENRTTYRPFRQLIKTARELRSSYSDLSKFKCRRRGAEARKVFIEKQNDSGNAAKAEPAARVARVGELGPPAAHADKLSHYAFLNGSRDFSVTAVFMLAAATAHGTGA
jgi:hypothetical protein